MKEDLFTNLPREMMVDILSRLPIPTIMSSKCVCKSWCDLIESREFANSHRAKSVPLLVFQKLYDEKPCEVIEFIDDQKNPRFNKSFSFNLPLSLVIKSSVDGLLLLKHHGHSMPLYICNPITREYIELPHPPYYPEYSSVYGFGVSKISCQYKIFCVNIDKSGRPKWDEGYIYTLGTGCWRSIIPNDDEKLQTYTYMGVFLNGNLHWLAYDDGATPWIRCLDLETELFSTFSTPGLECSYEYHSLTALGDRLCLLCYSYTAEEIVIWLMKEYGDEKSWTKEIVIKEMCTFFCEINVYNNVYAGDDKLFCMWAMGYNGKLFCISNKTNTVRTINLPGLMHTYRSTNAVAYTPSFLPQLKSFENENVSSL